MTEISFWIPGKPAPQGSKRHIGNGRMIESCKTLAPWRERVALSAHNAMLGTSLFQTATTIRLDFVMVRPVSTPKTRTPDAIKKPDLDKLIRACCDAITHIVISDDSIITSITATKRLAELGEEPGVQIHAES